MASDAGKNFLFSSCCFINSLILLWKSCRLYREHIDSTGWWGRFTGGAGDDSRLKLWCLSRQACDRNFLPPLQISEDVENRLESLSAQIILCDTVLKDLKELCEVLVVSHVFFQFCDFLHILKFLLNVIILTFLIPVVFHRKDLSRMGRSHSNNEDQWSSILVIL